jgi:hypothetical protein
MNYILKNKKAVLFAFSLIIMQLNACKKYPEDEGIHLYRTAKYRLVGTWIVNQLLVNGADATGAFMDLNPTYEFKIKRSGEYTIIGEGFRVDPSGNKYSYITNIEGTWQFLDAKKNIALTEGLFSSNIDKYEIRKLTKKELWLRQKNGLTVTETHYVSK